MQIVRDHLMRDGKQQGRVGAGTDADELVCEDLGGVVIDGVDDDHLRAAPLRLQEREDGVALARPDGIVPPQDDELGGQVFVPVGQRERVARPAAAHHFLRRPVEAARRPARPHGGRPANGVEEPARAAALGRKDGGVAIGVDDALDFGRRQVERLFPADAHPLVAAAERTVSAAGLPVLALEGVLQAVGAEHQLAHGTPAEASALLRGIEGVRPRHVGAVAHDHAVFHVHLVHAVAAAVEPARGVLPRAVHLVGLRGMALLFFLFLFGRLAAHQPCRCHGACGSRTPLHEASPAQARFV